MNHDDPNRLLPFLDRTRLKITVTINILLNKWL